MKTFGFLSLFMIQDILKDSFICISVYLFSYDTYKNSQIQIYINLMLSKRWQRKRGKYYVR